MARFTQVIVGAALIATGIVLEIETDGWLPAYIISAGVGMVLSGIGTLLQKTQSGYGSASRHPVAPWNVIYGRTRVGGKFVFINEFGNNNTYIHLVLVLACHACESVDSLLFDGKRILLDSNGNSFNQPQQSANIISITRSNGVVTVQVEGLGYSYIQTGDFMVIAGVADPTFDATVVVTVVNATTFTYLNGGIDDSSSGGTVSTAWAQYDGFVHMEALLGDQTLGQTFPGILEGVNMNDGSFALNGFNPWNASCSLQGKTAVFLLLHYNDGVFSNGLPNISFLVHGKNDIADPRTTPATVGYTENAALCVADYLAQPTWGFKAPLTSEINIPQLIAAANICDEQVQLANGDTEPRYACNGQFELTTKRGEALQNLLTACAGRIVYRGGVVPAGAPIGPPISASIPIVLIAPLDIVVSPTEGLPGDEQSVFPPMYSSFAIQLEPAQAMGGSGPAVASITTTDLETLPVNGVYYYSTITIVFETPSGLSQGDDVTITGNSVAAFNGYQLGGADIIDDYTVKITYYTPTYMQGTGGNLYTGAEPGNGMVPGLPLPIEEYITPGLMVTISGSPGPYNGTYKVLWVSGVTINVAAAPLLPLSAPTSDGGLLSFTAPTPTATDTMAGQFYIYPAAYPGVTSSIPASSAPPPSGEWAFLRSGNQPPDGVSSLELDISNLPYTETPLTVSSGNTIFVHVCDFYNLGGPFDVTDSQGNTYTQQAVFNGGGINAYLYMANASATGALTVIIRNTNLTTIAQWQNQALFAYVAIFSSIISIAAIAEGDNSTFSVPAQLTVPSMTVGEGITWQIGFPTPNAAAFSGDPPSTGPDATFVVVPSPVQGVLIFSVSNEIGQTWALNAPSFATLNGAPFPKLTPGWNAGGGTQSLNLLILTGASAAASPPVSPPSTNDQNAELAAMLAGPIRWRSKLQLRDVFNGVKGTYVSPVNNWLPSDIPPYAQDNLHGYNSMVGSPPVPVPYGDLNLYEDGGDRRWKDIQLPFTISVAAAQRICKIELMRIRQQGLGTFPFNLSAYNLTPLDVVLFTFPVFDWYQKLLEVQAVRLKVTKSQEQAGNEVVLLGTEVDLQETDPSVYEWSDSEELTAQGFQQPYAGSGSGPMGPTGVGIGNFGAFISVNSQVGGG